MKSFGLTLNSEMAKLVLLVVITGLFSGCPAVSSSPESPPDKVCERHLARLGAAIAEYRAEKGSLPHSTENIAGFKCSWRVLIVPYLRGSGSQRVNYRRDESWDSQHNRQQLLNWVPCRFTCPLESNSVDYRFVTYVMLVRPKPSDSPDGSSEKSTLPPEAVLIVESANCGIEYGEPRDLDWDSLWEGDSPFGKGKLNSDHPNVVKALRVDGKVIDIPKTIGKEELRKLLSGKK